MILDEPQHDHLARLGLRIPKVTDLALLHAPTTVHISDVTVTLNEAKWEHVVWLGLRIF